MHLFKNKNVTCMSSQKVAKLKSPITLFFENFHSILPFDCSFLEIILYNAMGTTTSPSFMKIGWKTKKFY